MRSWENAEEPFSECVWEFLGGPTKAEDRNGTILVFGQLHQFRCQHCTIFETRDARMQCAKSTTLAKKGHISLSKCCVWANLIMSSINQFDEVLPPLSFPEHVSASKEWEEWNQYGRQCAAQSGRNTNNSAKIGDKLSAIETILN